MPQPTGAMIRGNTQAATISIIAAAIAVAPLLAVGVLMLFGVEVTSTLVFKGVAVVACFFGVIAVGASAMALNGRLTLYIGFTVGFAYASGVVALGAVLMIGLFGGLLSLMAWLCIILAVLAGSATLFGIYRRCAQSPAVV